MVSVPVDVMFEDRASGKAGAHMEIIAVAHPPPLRLKSVSLDG